MWKVLMCLLKRVYEVPFGRIKRPPMTDVAATHHSVQPIAVAFLTRSTTLSTPSLRMTRPR